MKRIIVFIGLSLVLYVSWLLGYTFIDPSKFGSWIEYTVLSTIWGLGVLMVPCLFCFLIFALIKFIWELATY